MQNSQVFIFARVFYADKNSENCKNMVLAKTCK